MSSCGSNTPVHSDLYFLCALPKALWWFGGKWKPQSSIHPPDKTYHCTWQLEPWSQSDRNMFLYFTGMWTQVNSWEDFQVSSLAVKGLALVLEQLSFAGCSAPGVCSFQHGLQISEQKSDSIKARRFHCGLCAFLLKNLHWIVGAGQWFEDFLSRSEFNIRQPANPIHCGKNAV